MSNQDLERLLEDKEAEVAKKRKTISIKTVREPNYSGNVGNAFPEDFDYRGYFSYIEFSHPVKYFEGEENKKLRLRTLFFSSGQCGGYDWHQILDGENGCALSQGRNFAHLEGEFHDYRKHKLQEWQKTALSAHKKILDGIEESYFSSKGLEISKNFLR